MAEGNGLTCCPQHTKKKLKSKEDFHSLYEQIQVDNPTLIANKLFWSRKGNSQKYMCILCNRSIQMSTNLKALKSVVLAHVEDKYHKKRFDDYTTMKNNNHLEESKNDVTEEKVKIKTNTSKKSILTLIEEAEESVSIVQKAQSETENKEVEESLDNSSGAEIDFDSIYNTFDGSNPVIKASKQYIVKLDNSRHYFCTLCQMMVFSPPYEIVFKYNLWVHLNEESHREKLPNFKEVQKNFCDVIQKIFKALPSCYKENQQYFEIGPAFRFANCTLCEAAVSVNVHRLENHFKGGEHLDNKKKLTTKGEIKREPLSNRTRSAFRKLVVKLESPYRKDIKYIHIGKIPGYVVCHICCHVILPTQFYVQTHFDSEVHLKNKRKAQTLQSKSLAVLMKTLPNDLQDFNIFEENMCGLLCKRCHTSIPPTSYDLYSHITKERHSIFV